MNVKKEFDPKCVLDRSLINPDTFPMMKNLGLSVFASACSKNRGAFVLHPSDGKTYGCLAFPDTMLDMIGIEVDEASINPNTSEPIFQINTVEDITKHYADGNLTASDAVEIVDFLVTNVYQSTPAVADTPYACDVSGLVTLKCNNDPKSKPTVRAVTMAGVFTPALWATGGKELSHKEASAFYTSKDYKEMKKLGLNAVQIPIPVKMFSKAHEKEAKKWKELLTDTMHDIRKAGGLDVLLVLEQGDSPPEDVASPVEAASIFAQDYNDDHGDIVLALTLPKLDKALLEAANKAAPGLNIWVPSTEGDFTKLGFFSSAAGVSMSLAHTASVADIASSSSEEDRGKLFYHENMACIARAPLEYSSCYQDMPVTVSRGFDLAIDNCHMEGLDVAFQDYGQCGRFNETVYSPWWKNHRYSFAARQLFAYEQGRGWSFASWKLWESDSEDLGVLDVPAKLLSFQDVAAAGIMPSLFDMDTPIEYPLSNSSSPVGLACLNPPMDDFAMGDRTLAPTPAPPPSCGNGWWNFTTEQCDYWVPPTPAPTEPCPVCAFECPPSKDATDVSLMSLMPESLMGSGGNSPVSASHKTVAAQSFFAGSVLSLIGAFVVYRMTGRHNRRQGYEQVPGDISGVVNDNGIYQGA